MVNREHLARKVLALAHICASNNAGIPCFQHLPSFLALDVQPSSEHFFPPYIFPRRKKCKTALTMSVLPAESY